MRLINHLRCWFSYLLSLVGIVRVRHLPTFISVEPANYCQLRCPECPVGQRATNHEIRHANNLSLETYQLVLDQVKDTATTIQFYFQGEPLLNPLLPEMIAQAHDSGLFTIVSTNAQALTKELAFQLVRSGLHRIIVSIDGFSEESYSAYRMGGDLQKALDGLYFLHQAKKELKSSICIELQVLRLKTNEHEWKWVRRHYKQLGATRLVFKTAQLHDYQHGHPLMPSQSKYSRYQQAADGRYYLYRSWLRRHWPNTPCYRLWSGCVITTTGEVLPCCYDKSSRYTYGSLKQHSLIDIWHGKKANAFRRIVLHENHHIPMCQECNL